MEEELLKTLEEDLGICKDYLLIMAKSVLAEDISNYPIFVAHKEEVGIGKVIINKEELGIRWSFSASHLEEFVNREIIQDAKVNEFRKVFEDPLQKACVFVLTEEAANFVFIDY